MTFNCQRREPKQDPPGRLSGDFGIHELEKLLVVEREKISILQDSVHKKRSETRNIFIFRVVLLHKGFCFEKYHSVTNC